jgi:hypothetical protein
MTNLENEFLNDIEETIKLRNAAQVRYKLAELALMATIAGSGFLTAAASQDATKIPWLASKTALLVYGLASAICAIVNKILTPSEKSAFHRKVKLALYRIKGEVKYRGMSASDAESLRVIAVTSPDAILEKIQSKPDNKGKDPTESRR